jgi:hypothetical protein
MTHASLLTGGFEAVTGRLGGPAYIEKTARETRAFVRGREIGSAVVLLRLILSYCLGGKGLRSTAAWAASLGLADISNVALLYRLRQCGDWLSLLVSHALSSSCPKAAQARMIRIVDATTVPKAGQKAKRNNGLWRLHSAFDLPLERFSHFELTDEGEGERLDRIPVIPGEIRLADRAYLAADRVAPVLEAGGDIIVRAGWKRARWLNAEGEPFDLIAALKKAAKAGKMDRPIWLGRKGRRPALGLRLVAVRKPPQARAEARRKARRAAQRERSKISHKTLIAAEWVILVTSLPAETYATDDVLALYRLRWRIELAFKRLKSLIGLKEPPGFDERSAKPWILAHLLLILLTEPLAGELDDSPPALAA